MQTRIVGADAGTAASLADRLTDALATFSMLGVCTSPGCTTMLFGEGTCVAHDPPRLYLPEPFLETATGSEVALTNTSSG
jgi:hypothetical protein